MVASGNLEALATVFIVDDDESVRNALARLLTSAGYRVDKCGSAAELLNRARREDISGCLVLDVRMPGVGGLDLQQELKSVAPALPIIFLTGHGDVSTSVRAMKGGAVDFLTKPVDGDKLLAAVAEAIARNREARAHYAQLREIRQRVQTLTPREFEVMRLVVQGRLNKQIAGELGTVEKTIKVHRSRVIKKMGVESVAELVWAAGKLEESAAQAFRLRGHP